jgi:hypothetical protein
MRNSKTCFSLPGTPEYSCGVFLSGQLHLPPSDLGSSYTKFYGYVQQINHEFWIKTTKEEGNIENAEVKILKSVAGYTKREQVRNINNREQLNILNPHSFLFSSCVLHALPILSYLP